MIPGGFSEHGWGGRICDADLLHRHLAYRVLLTRARQGLIVFVPLGDAKDPTRPPAFYDETYAFLVSCGMPELK
jgi:hypothetical protein